MHFKGNRIILGAFLRQCESFPRHDSLSREFDTALGG